jgi:predicted O-methyltransferase YrrM
MSARTDVIDERTSGQVRALSMLRESATLARLREKTATMPKAQMQISVEQGRLMALLVDMLGARRCLEVGVFTGYSALCVAERLPPGGKLVACDISEEWTSVAKPFWRDAKVADRIDLRLGPASATLAAFVQAGEAGSYDFAFIDADKDQYEGYYEQCLVLVRAGGMIAIDNIFMRGRTFDPTSTDAGSVAVRTLTEKIFSDRRVDPSLVPIGDGLLLARKR